MNRFAVFALVLALGAVWLEPRASAAEVDALFRQAVSAIESGSFEDAIARFEAMAEQGLTHPDASYNRGVAYVARAETAQGRPGDWGRASAAFREALLLRPGDDQAERALDRVREEIARRRPASAAQRIIDDESLGRAVVALASEDVWSWLSLAGSVLATVGLALALWVRRPNTRVPAMLAIGVGTSMLVVCGALAGFARHFRIAEALAVVVVPEARLLDERAVPRATGRGSAAPEGAEVRVSEEKGALVKIQWGLEEGWVLRNQLRLLARP